MTRFAAALLAAAVVVLCSVILLSVGNVHSDSPSRLSIDLLHGDIAIRSSSFASTAPIKGEDFDFTEILAITSSITLDDVNALSEEIFMKSKFSVYGSHNNRSSAHFSTRKLLSKAGDKQFFVQFSTPADIYTLVALGKFTGQRVVSHIHDNLYVVIGNEAFASKARQFPGVAFVQERVGSNKIGINLKQQLDSLAQENGFTRLRRRVLPSTRISDSNPVITVTAECLYDSCGTAAVAVQPLCGDIYVHAGLIEVLCATDMVARAVALLADQVGVEHIEMKDVMETYNFAGSAILGSGPLATNPAQSRVVTNIDVSSSVVAVADTGINMNNCFFFDNGRVANSRVVRDYTFLPGPMCGRADACGDMVDANGHGTHVAGTVLGNAGNAATNPTAAAGNGIAAGARVFFQDMQPAPGVLSAPTNLANLFQPAYNAGARVHVNSWGCGGATPANPFMCGTYSSRSRDVDAFAFANRDFLVVFAAGNSGRNSFSRTIGNPGTCKNCITVGATQLSDSLFRGMSPFIDQGHHCRLDPNAGCCANNGALNCVRSSPTVSPCCELTARTRMSLACCPTQVACSGCTVQSGNIRHAYNVATFSSRGTLFSDGRIKPDLVVPGEDILSALAPGVDANGQLIPTDSNYCGIPSATVPRTLAQSRNMALGLNSGTSMAAPLAAGGIEKIRQYFLQGRYPSGNAGGATINPDESLLRAVILASAKPLGGTGGVWTSLPFQTGFSRFPIPQNSNIPDIFGGFGMPVLDDAVTMPGGTYRMLYASETFSATSGASAFTIACTPSQAIPVTLVLAWTDPPGSTASERQLVNDLDLIVLSPSQLFGNMRPYADSTNVVERTISACPASGTITAIVRQGESIRTASQTWYLVANGAVNSITRLGAVPAHDAGRLTNPATTTTNCMAAPRTNHRLRFLTGQQWSGSSWDIELRIQEFTTALATVARVNQQAIVVSVTSPADGTISLSLGCSSLLTSSTGTVAFITAATLRAVISAHCVRTNSPCVADPILRVVDWNNIMDDMVCGNGITCAFGQTCMSSANGAGNRFACSPLSNAVRCGDARFSCPFQSTCSQTGNTCIRNGVTSAATLNVNPVSSTPVGICGQIISNFQLPNYCTCAQVNFGDDPRSLGGRITCSTQLPSTVRVTAQATFMPCSRLRPTFFTFSATADATVTTLNLANGPFAMSNLPISGSAITMGISRQTNNIRITGGVTNSRIDARFSIGDCTVTNLVTTCRDATHDVPLISGNFDFAGMCPA